MLQKTVKVIHLEYGDLEPQKGDLELISLGVCVGCVGRGVFCFQKCFFVGGPQIRGSRENIPDDIASQFH